MIAKLFLIYLDKIVYILAKNNSKKMCDQLPTLKRGVRYTFYSKEPCDDKMVENTFTPIFVEIAGKSMIVSSYYCATNSDFNDCGNSKHSLPTEWIVAYKPC